MGVAISCIQDTLSSRAALGLTAVQPLGRVRRASKGILHTRPFPAEPPQQFSLGLVLQDTFARARTRTKGDRVYCIQVTAPTMLVNGYLEIKYHKKSG